MKLALIGHGAMGKLIEKIALERGHEITAIIDERHAEAEEHALAGMILDAEAAIDFSVAEAIVRNVKVCAEANVPLVVGTTGWLKNIKQVKKLVEANNAALLYGANFSIGVNIFYKLAAAAAEMFKPFDEYEAFIEERHHSRKKDAPSGTALKIKELAETVMGKDVAAASTRAGNISGTHTLGFAGRFDEVILTHRANSRDGFAAGAITAAEWLKDKKGFYEFTDVIDEMI